MARGSFDSTAGIEIPTNPFERIIGQDEAIRIARIAPKQRRHILLVGPPGTGKSLIAQAIASLLPKPKQEISVVHNPERPERPLIEVSEDRAKAKSKREQFGKQIKPEDVPTQIAERLGIRCRRCGTLLRSSGTACATCHALPNNESKKRIGAISDGSEGDDFYSIAGNGMILIQTESEIRQEEDSDKKSKRKVLLSLDRKTFIQASGASETELLGDVAHDPMGGSGTPPYMRVLLGAIHEAHEGVLFIDELSTLGNLQRHILTAMQDKVFPIAGRNATSSGASVRVDSVPCDFIFVGASNMNDIQNILPALRSRISGDGYEVLMNSCMPENEKNREKLTQFIAQEIIRDGRIPHADLEAVDALIAHAKSIAKDVDGESNSFTLRLRNLAGVIKLSGDIASSEDNKLISKEDVLSAIESSRSLEEKIEERYGSPWKAGAADYTNKKRKNGKETI